MESVKDNTHQNFDSIVFACVIVSFISFFFWRNNHFLSIFSRRSNTSTINNDSNVNNSNSNVNNNINNTNNSATNNSNEPIQENQTESEPFQENFSSDIQDLIKINIIQNEKIHHRTFRTSKILKVYDLKKYFYPKEIELNKRILFIYNGRAMIDSHTLGSHLNLLNGINPACIHCLIKDQLTPDQVSNDPNYSGYNGHNGDSTFTWLCTKTLFFFTGLFLSILWFLQFTNPKLFNFVSSFVLLILTLFWALGFYSSLKSSNTQPTNTNHPHSD
ncbi:hypothetical protein DICPUDRAFT_96503 [Dictyostelium purpureum]|uniref:Ubiquitin-like domain-containing protein n=1 Tax=Dictyostelium purpureum TaxID=5786 RepID=F0Z8V2_DICPU|nr:uncharacterized protein DICPUDRAFT_96503 [Dictyostelium purpureum]EGC39608.1 hypothetical protein DICPUDRAFT_96503 [Dictyostelium purpureum]|eukprot:XP_003283829.1 hypothetical protein DICPUDRAFT_96503 [Dictyostelium purpureum]